jgi:nucleoside-diphosphate-sugar epimerase
MRYIKTLSYITINTGLANRDLGWQAETTLKETMRSACKWEQKLNEEK